MEYNPLESPLGCSVFGSVRMAYPSFAADDFNGGNVLIGEDGTATIRVRNPATYTYGMWYYAAMPHIHLRVCDGSAVNTDHLMVEFGICGVTALGDNTLAEVTVASATPYADKADIDSSDHNGCGGFIAQGVVCGWTGGEDCASTTMTTTAAVGYMDIIDAAMDRLRLDALEFSPIYLCLLEEQFYDHFADDCAETCPTDADVIHGQCVREANTTVEVEISAQWGLAIDCDGSTCDFDSRRTLHGIRLSAAGHLDISFQEVVEIGLSDWTDRRRRLGLSDAASAYPDATLMVLTINVQTTRLLEEAATALLDTFLDDPSEATALLGFTVQYVEQIVEQVDTDNTMSIDNSTDPYQPAYSVLEASLPSEDSDTSLPLWLTAVCDTVHRICGGGDLRSARGCGTSDLSISPSLSTVLSGRAVASCATVHRVSPALPHRATPCQTIVHRGTLQHCRSMPRCAAQGRTAACPWGTERFNHPTSHIALFLSSPQRLVPPRGHAIPRCSAPTSVVTGVCCHRARCLCFDGGAVADSHCTRAVDACFKAPQCRLKKKKKKKKKKSAGKPVS
eukprot:NODE_4315_length_1906_cov_7.228218.p1 GENE.NODE_4315_length_1906_cov_7.228218~~NODE_4315_length_1906_cov_7.228218.p1  ORF type:complete len:610 (+),score=155.77 NODE_4315_length_1906_cov_7.228218:140-1831(+)